MIPRFLFFLYAIYKFRTLILSSYLRVVFFSLQQVNITFLLVRLLSGYYIGPEPTRLVLRSRICCFSVFQKRRALKIDTTTTTKPITTVHSPSCAESLIDQWTPLQTGAVLRRVVAGPRPGQVFRP
uniref:Uncharacterized protein n=1 Tax=Helianthus annuus TaxID=4232 RepID=A0A251SVW2_HELAN